ncbi:MAG: AAA family ATPase [Bernardetiaceae bacterium]|nr:AAA family ATPase [Bernardetiaceae bacterium]
MVFRTKKNLEQAYKFKSLKTYASTEWLADGMKRYRTVFEASETSYLYAELALYNKLYDVEDWEVQITLKSYRIQAPNNREEICKINVTQKVSKDIPIFYVREGWGNHEKGAFWTRGDYIWEAYINGELAGSRPFYIENGGIVTPEENPYFTIENIALYEGANQGVEKSERVYLSEFSATDTRYVWAELLIQNKQQEDWFCEFVFNFYNSAGQLKGRTIELRRVSRNEGAITFATGWGSDGKGSWHYNHYRLEIVFMDKLIAVMPFKVGKKAVEGTAPFISGQAILRMLHKYTPELQEQEATLEEVIGDIDELVGLYAIKRKIKDYTQYLKFVQIRREHGFKEEEKLNLHAVFKGNPGTGKTTLARLLGKIYKNLGLLSTGTVHEVGRAELVGQFIGQTAPKVKELIEKARGGVLFIDEAYSLVRNNDDGKDYGQEVIETLVKEMSDGHGDIAIIAAGYPKEMNVFLKSNPGLKSRFALQFDFPDYMPQELFQIAELASQKYEIKFSPEAKTLFHKKITDAYRKRDASFGNARAVYNMIEEVKISLGLRIMAQKEEHKAKNEKLSKTELSEVLPIDVEQMNEFKQKAIPQIDVDEELLEEALNELNEMIGLKSVKERVYELVKLVRFYRQTNRLILNHFSLHSIFKGNPGTGKTTVARLLSKIYRALGILERGHIVECDRQGLVAGFVGQTAIKTNDKIEESIGGMLFIDEAYSLSSSAETHNDFGREALEIILKQMEDRRGEFVVIAAGYPDNMDKFLASNPGLKSRFDKTFIFEDFTAEELYQIAVFFLDKANLEADKNAEKYLRDSLNELILRKDKFFGNARTVRKIIEEAIKQQHLRVAQIPIEKRTQKILKYIKREDLEKISFKNDELSGKRPVGFRLSDK